jgi:hypothetical protein
LLNRENYIKPGVETFTGASVLPPAPRESMLSQVLLIVCILYVQKQVPAMIFRLKSRSIKQLLYFAGNPFYKLSGKRTNKHSP